MEPSTVSGAVNPSARSAPRNVLVCQRPQGVFSNSQVPRGERSSWCVMLVLAHVFINEHDLGSIDLVL